MLCCVRWLPTLEVSRGVAAAVKALAGGNNDAALPTVSATNAAAYKAAEAAKRRTLHTMGTAESLESHYAYLS